MQINPDISLASIKEAISYDPDTGVFLRLKTVSRAKAGERCDYPEPTGYRRVRVGGYRMYAHRLAWFYVYGAWPSNEIDHINRDKKDNRISNLRDVTRVTNQRNLPDWGVVPFRGVRLSGNGKGYQAQISLNGRTEYLGSYRTAEDAHAAFIKAAQDR